MAATGQGKLTPQYICVQKNFAKLKGLLQVNAGTKSNLSDQLTAKGWLVPGAPDEPKDLVNVVLERIESNATAYNDFIAMLQECGGAGHIVTALLGAMHYNSLSLTHTPLSLILFIFNFTDACPISSDQGEYS